MVVIPQLETERLLLRAPRESDFEAMQDYLALERTKFIGGPYDETATWRTLLSMLGHWQLKGYGFWQIEHWQTGRLAGAVGFINHFDWPEPELGWSVHHDFEGQGIAYEAALAARAFGESALGLTQVVSFIVPENTRSAALAHRLGATLEKSMTIRGTECDVYRHPKPEAA